MAYLYYVPPTSAKGSAPDADILEIYADLEAREATALARAAVKLDPGVRASEAMAGYADEVLSRARAWSWVHYSRADKRGLAAGAEAFADLAETLGALQDAIETNGIAASVVHDARSAYEAAFLFASRRGEVGHYERAAFDHECEAEESPIRELCSVLADIFDRQSQMIEGFLRPAEAQLAAAEDLISAPFPPSPGELDTEQ